MTVDTELPLSMKTWKLSKLLLTLPMLAFLAGGCADNDDPLAPTTASAPEVAPDPIAADAYIVDVEAGGEVIVPMYRVLPDALYIAGDNTTSDETIATVTQHAPNTGAYWLVTGLSAGTTEYEAQAVSSAYRVISRTMTINVSGVAARMDTIEVTVDVGSIARETFSTVLEGSNTFAIRKRGNPSIAGMYINVPAMMIHGESVGTTHYDLTALTINLTTGAREAAKDFVAKIIVSGENMPTLDYAMEITAGQTAMLDLDAMLEGVTQWQLISTSDGGKEVAILNEGANSGYQSTIRLRAIAEGEADYEIKLIDTRASPRQYLKVLVDLTVLPGLGAGNVLALIDGGLYQVREGDTVHVALIFEHEPPSEDLELPFTITAPALPAAVRSLAYDFVRNDAEPDYVLDGEYDGVIAIAAGESTATIKLIITDDDRPEPPAEEVLVVKVTPTAGTDLEETVVTLRIMEGVCDRTPFMQREINKWIYYRDAMPADCSQFDGAQLAAVRNLMVNGDSRRTRLKALSPDPYLKKGDFAGFTGATLLDFAIVSTTNFAWQDTLFADLTSVRRIRAPNVMGDRLADDMFAGMTSVTRIDWFTFPWSSYLNRAFKTVEEGAFRGLPKLTHVSFGGSNAKTLPEDLFTHAPTLTYLHLDQLPNMRTLPKNLLLRLENLQTFLVSRTPVGNRLPKGLLRQNNALRILTLHDVGMTKSNVRSLFRNSVAPSLDQLSLSNNQLKSANEIVKPEWFPALTALHLNGNSIKSLHVDSFEGMELQKVDLHGNPGVPFQVTAKMVSNADNQVRVRTNVKMPATMRFRVYGTNFEEDGTELVIPAGSNESPWMDVTQVTEGETVFMD